MERIIHSTRLLRADEYLCECIRLLFFSVRERDDVVSVFRSEKRQHDGGVGVVEEVEKTKKKKSPRRVKIFPFFLFNLKNCGTERNENEENRDAEIFSRASCSRRYRGVVHSFYLY